MLYRFREAQAAELGGGKMRLRRPNFAGVVNTVQEAEKWRRDILSEISRKISKIQDGKNPAFISYTWNLMLFFS